MVPEEDAPNESVDGHSQLLSQGMYYQNNGTSVPEDKPARVPLLVAVPAGAEAYRLVEDR